MHLEEMGAFFTARADIYDKRQLENIGGPELYDAVAEYLPERVSALLDLGCGSGLELERVFDRFPGADVTGIDLSDGLIIKLRTKFSDKKLTILQMDYFEYSYPNAAFDAVISAESLHHFSREKKQALYENIFRSLKPGGRFVNADYVAGSDAEERRYFAEFDLIMKEMGNPPGYYHFDTPLTPESELELMKRAGFSSAQMEQRLGNSVIFTADK